MASNTNPAWMKRVHVPQGFPKSNTDAAPTAAFLALFFLTALSHMFIFFRNKKRGHKFLFNGLCIGFCMARVVTSSLRLAWIYNIQSRNLAIAATIFVAAGVLLLFIINLFFAQRILRGLHPHLGWHKGISKAFLVMYLLIIPLLIMVVTATTQSFFTTDKNIVRMDIDMQRGASTYFLVVALLPLPITIFALTYPKATDPDHFGKGSFKLKAAIVMFASTLLTLGAGFRTGTSFETFKPEYATNPPWWNAKWCFYFFNFTLELIVVLMYLVVRIDLVFHIPNGSHGPGSYSRGQTEAGEKEDFESEGSQRASTDNIGDTTEPPQTPVGPQATEHFHV